LKKNAVSIFEINDIKMEDFLQVDTREASLQLEELREGNTFLFGSEAALPGINAIGRYFRSGCIARVRYFNFVQPN
jgi:hypothetical protein